jgi:F0F1-type ATP synthase membrane subunit b/b'
MVSDAAKQKASAAADAAKQKAQHAINANKDQAKAKVQDELKKGLKGLFK